MYVTELCVLALTLNELEPTCILKNGQNPIDSSVCCNVKGSSLVGIFSPVYPQLCAHEEVGRCSWLGDGG